MLAIERLCKSYASKLLFDDVSFQFPDGEKIALVGPNGAGKSTLLNMICGIENADSGQVLRSQNLKIGYLPQEPANDPMDTILEECLRGHTRLHALREAMNLALQVLQHTSSEQHITDYEQAETAFRREGGYSSEGRAASILTGLGFVTPQLKASPLSLSGGWRMRLELAKVFMNDPDILVLDEPTNHLDLPSLVWVEQYLQSFRGTLLFVSHDRSLLNRLATVTILISSGRLRSYKGNFDQMLEQRDLEEIQNESRRSNLERQREQLEDFVERFGAKASKARQAQSKAKQIERIRKLELEIDDPSQNSVMAFRLPDVPTSGRDVLLVKDLAIGYDRPLAHGINLHIERTWRVAIIGSNGIGKSTFLKTLNGQISPLQGDIQFGHNVTSVYCAQNQEEILDYNRTILENILSARRDLGESEARQILGSFLFSGDSIFKEVRILSGGEKARVALCRSIVNPANFLILDEPTNHLDMSSVEILIEGLKNYRGTLLFVSHDRNFIDALATHIFVMLADGRSALFHGTLDDYARLAKQQGFPNLLEPTSDSSSETQKMSQPKGRSESDEQAKNLKRERNRLQKTLEKLENEQKSLKTQCTKLEETIALLDPSAYQEAYASNKLLVECQARLAETEDLWLSTATDLENIEEQLLNMGRLT